MENFSATGYKGILSAMLSVPATLLVVIIVAVIGTAIAGWSWAKAIGALCFIVLIIDSALRVLT